MSEEDKKFLKEVHSIIEGYLCQRDGLHPEKLREFEDRFELMKHDYPDLVGEMEAGDHEFAPHYKQHKIANMMVKWLEDNMKLSNE